jgi:hypothetical protein
MPSGVDRLTVEAHAQAMSEKVRCDSVACAAVSVRDAEPRLSTPSERSRTDAVKDRFEAAKKKVFRVHAELFRQLAE